MTMTLLIQTGRSWKSDIELRRISISSRQNRSLNRRMRVSAPLLLSVVSAFYAHACGGRFLRCISDCRSADARHPSAGTSVALG